MNMKDADRLALRAMGNDSYDADRIVDALDDDRDPNDPNEMTADEWSGFYGDCEEPTGVSYDEYLDHDHSTDF